MERPSSPQANPSEGKSSEANSFHAKKPLNESEPSAEGSQTAEDLAAEAAASVQDAAADSASAGEARPAASQRSAPSKPSVGWTTEGEQVQVEQTQNFQCPNCGADLHYNAGKGLLTCEHCGTEEPVPTPENWSAEEHTSFDEDQIARVWEGKRMIACKSCGGSWVVDATEAASACPFCGRAQVTALDVTMVPPDAVIPFAMDVKQAESRFKAWVSKRRMSPRALRDEAFAGHWRGIYYPYWTYDTHTETQYVANAGHYYYVAETRTRVVNGKTETYVQQVRHTRWERVSGRVSRFFDDILIRAVKLTEKAAAPENFDLSALKPYMPQFLSGFLARRYEIGLKEGYAQASTLMRAQIERDIEADVAADEVQILQTNITPSKQSYKHILLPLWGNHYAYRGKQYDVWVNGQSGQVSGKAPLSPWKVAFAVLLGIAACVGLVYLMSNMMMYME